MTDAPAVAPEPILSANRARVILASLKGTKKLDAATLVHLVQKEGLPKHSDPFGTGRWVFYKTEITSWFQARMAGDHPKPLRGPGRPRKERA